MQAVILAAGIGKRLMPITNNIPKPMVVVNGSPILEHSLSILPKDINEVILVVGYKRDSIIEYFGDLYNGKKLIYAIQNVPMGTADALDKARPFLKEGPFLFLYGDDLYHPDDLERCIGNEPVVLVKETSTPENFGVCLVNEEGFLTGILEKHKNPPSNLVNIGVYLLNHEIFEVPRVQLQNGEYNLAEQIGRWANKRAIRAIKAKFWHPIGNPEDLTPAERFLSLPVHQRVN